MSDTPMYETIYRFLLEGINGGTYPVGSKLPTEKELCERFSVSRITGKHALDLLAQDGHIERKKGSGSFVLRAPEIPPTQERTPPATGRLLGVVMPDFSESFGMRILYGIEEACAEYGCNFVLRRSGGDEQREREVLTDLRALGTHGMAVMPVHGEYYNPVLLQCILDGFPVALMDRSLRGINAGLVGTDSVASTRVAVRHLLELGHRNIAWISPPPDHTSTLEDRESGLNQELIDNNIVPNRALWFQNVRSTLPMRNKPACIEDDIKALTRHLREHSDITAAFASEYNVALIVREAARSIGMRVPGDLSIVCFDAPENAYSASEFTHIRQKECEMGRRLVEMLLGMIADGGCTDKRQSIVLEGEFIIGQTTDAPASI